MPAWKMQKTLWIVWYAISLHIAWAVCLTCDASAGGVTAIHHLMFMNRWAVVVLFASVGVGAGVGLLSRNRNWSLAALLPQQFVLMYSAWGAAAAIIASTFADGVPRPRAFIFADQLPAILAAVLHTFAIIEHHSRELLWLARHGRESV